LDQREDFDMDRMMLLLRLQVFRFAACLTVFMALFGAVRAQSTELLTIRTASGAHAFQVEVMRTPDERAKGLMFRRFMPQDRGMLFDFARTEPVAMWMQNTFISLDMVFIRADGSVARVHQRAEPLSTQTIPSGEPVLSVLELNAGVAEKIGIKSGDKVEHPLFSSK
jgi:uncharacterized protein